MQKSKIINKSLERNAQRLPNSNKTLHYHCRDFINNTSNNRDSFNIHIVKPVWQVRHDPLSAQVNQVITDSHQNHGYCPKHRRAWFSFS